MLNKGCQCSCNPTPVIVRTKQTKVVKPVVKKNIIEEEQFIEDVEEEEVMPVQKQRGKCIKQQRPVMCKLKRIGKIRNRMRNKIETAVEKHESNRCNCK